MSKDDIEAQIKEMLFRRENLKKEVLAITTELKERGQQLSLLGDRLQREPETVMIERDMVLLSRRDMHDRREVPHIPVSVFSLDEIAVFLNDLRKKQDALKETQGYLAAQGYGG